MFVSGFPLNKNLYGLSFPTCATNGFVSPGGTAQQRIADAPLDAQRAEVVLERLEQWAYVLVESHFVGFLYKVCPGF